ncbi:hypothetical protein [Pseudoclavibacter sp. CFCC 13611]|uniref:hypothetical protein n=1 Tax=Pseudoclavibacter sp. CFCC 13611 TaxID=2615178 RepID=UPI00130136A0|nr:hypothetical protein [Pseudoclavibacter sp. CFCC 13611]KAB1662667.1 hypothetical protein F8O08_08785 [Pseudoclavibacter sp. CFCC 13611]
MMLTAGLLLSACVTPKKPAVEAFPNLEAAKTSLFDHRNEILALLPEGSIVEHTGSPDRKRTVFKCNEEETLFSWPSTSDTKVTLETDLWAHAHQVEQEWGARPEWRLEWDETAGGTTNLYMKHENGMSLNMFIHNDTHWLSIAGFTACFPIPDYNRFSEY